MKRLTRAYRHVNPTTSLPEFPNAGQVMDDIDADCLEAGRIADAGAQQDSGTAHRAGAEDDLARRRRGLDPAAARVADAGDAVAGEPVDRDARHVGVNPRLRFDLAEVHGVPADSGTSSLAGSA